MPRQYYSVSSPDLSARYQEKQKDWILASKSAVEELEKHLRQPAFDFMTLLYIAAERRQKIAEELKHGTHEEPPATNLYGRWRDEHSQTYEMFHTNKQVGQGFPRQVQAIFGNVKRLLEDRLNLEEQTEETIKSSGYCVKKDDDIKGHTIRVVAPVVDGCSPSHSSILLATISIGTAPENIPLFQPVAGSEFVYIQYPPANKYDMEGNLNIAEHYVKECLAWDGKKGTMDEFLIRLGRLAHLMAHILPFDRGTCAITDWLIRAIAHAKDVELGAYSSINQQGLEISWDLEALTHPNREDYAVKYFAACAFSHRPYLINEEVAGGPGAAANPASEKEVYKGSDFFEKELIPIEKQPTTAASDQVAGGEKRSSGKPF